MAAALHRYDTACITKRRRYRALVEATGRGHWASIISNNIKGTYLHRFLLMFFIINTLKLVLSKRIAPTNTRGMTYQTKENHLNNLTEYFVGGVDTAFKRLRD
jgi:hypothetical protein